MGEPNWLKAGLSSGKGQCKFIEDNEGMPLDDYGDIEDIQDRIRYAMFDIHSLRLAANMDSHRIPKKIWLAWFDS